VSPRRALAAALLLTSLLAAGPADAVLRWGWLGVRIRDLSEQEMDEISKRYGLREGFGALIVDVLKETPADVAGLRTGDLVVAFKNQPVIDTRALQRYVSSAGVGETVTLTVLTVDKGRRPVEVRIAPMPDAVVAERVASQYGFLLREPDGGQPELGGAKPPAGPATVAVVLPKSRAEGAGLRVGDVLVEIDGKAVATIDAVRDALAGIPSDLAPLSLVVSRDHSRVSLVLSGANPR
jgi:serine protease Do